MRHFQVMATLVTGLGKRRRRRFDVEAHDEWAAQGEVSRQIQVSPDRLYLAGWQIDHAVADGDKACAWGCCKRIG